MNLDATEDYNPCTDADVMAAVAGSRDPDSDGSFCIMSTTITNGTTLMSPDANCDRYWSSKNFKIYRVFSAFGGLLDCFVLDIIVFLLCIVLFSILRKKAWNYGRIGLQERLEEGDLEGEMHAYNVWTTMFISDSPDRKRHSFDKRLLQVDLGLFAWILATFRIRDEDILRRCGPDAMHYLTFQKYLIGYQTVVAAVALLIVLPVNFRMGTYEGTKDTFARTTIINIDPNSPVLWIHCALGLLLLCIAIAFMRHFIDHVQFNVEEVSKTVMIRGIPKDKCYNHFLETHFEEAYPECAVTDIQFAFNVKLLVSLDFARLNAKAALVSSENTEAATGVRPKIMPYHCGAVVNHCCNCKCCKACGWNQVDAIDYYRGQLAMYQELCEAEKVNAFHDSLGIVFVTFSTYLMAQRVIRDFRMTCKGRHKMKKSSVSRMLHVRNWEVVPAPASSDIFWHNLSVGTVVWWVRALAVNAGILLIVIFCSTPSVILNQLNRIENFKSETENNVILHFLPTLFLTISSTLLPVIVSASDINLVKHYTRSSLNYTIMMKVFTFLLIMILALPSVGFSSVGSMLSWLTSESPDFSLRWNCIFVSSNCAFFVNYLISASTIGIGFDILRIADLVLYSLLWTLAKSQAERPMIRAYITSEFRYGTYYAWILCNFTVNMSYSIISPLMTIPGVTYLLLKHYVDRYNLCFVFKSSKIDNRIHETAINFVMTSVFCQQLTVFSFVLLRADTVTGISAFAMVTLVTMFLLFFFAICCGKIRLPGPQVDLTWDLPDSDHAVYDPDREEKEAPSFLPPVLEERDEDESYFPTNLPAVPTELPAELMTNDQVPEKRDSKKRKSSSKSGKRGSLIVDNKKRKSSSEGGKRSRLIEDAAMEDSPDTTDQLPRRTK